MIEQGTKLRKPVSEINPSMYRCAKTVPAPPYAERGSCNPDYESTMKLVGAPVTLPFSLETESAKSLQDRLTAGTLTSETLVKAYLTRIALTNAEGPALQAVRSLNHDAIEEAKTLDRERATSGPRGPLHGLPVLIDDTIDVQGLPTTAGSIALQKSMPRGDAALVAKLRAAGAIVLGKTNVTELGGLFDANMPEGYSSLGGQVLLPSDTDKTPAGSSAGSAAATAAGLAALTVGSRPRPTRAQLIAPAGVAGVVGFKPTVGSVNREGVLGIARSQDSPGPDRAHGDRRGVRVRGAVRDDRATGAPTALSGKRVAVISSTTAPYPAAVTAVTGLGATTATKTVGTPAPNPPSIVARSFERDAQRLPRRRVRRRRLAAGDRQLQRREPGRGAQVPAARADRGAVARTCRRSTPTWRPARRRTRPLIDALLADTDVIMVPSGNALVGIADRAGYPVLTVPAGYGTGGAGRNPIGVTFVGKARQRRGAARRRLRVRAGDERAARAELHEPEHVPLRRGEHVLLAAPLPSGRPAERDRVRPDRDAGGRRRRRHRAGDAVADARPGGDVRPRSRRAWRRHVHGVDDRERDLDRGRRRADGGRSEQRRHRAGWSTGRSRSRSRCRGWAS